MYCNHESFDCTKFYMVVYNHPVEMQCGPGTRFNLSLGVCDHEYNVECKNAQVEIQPNARPKVEPKADPDFPGVTYAGKYGTLLNLLCGHILSDKNLLIEHD